ncbi:MAG: hypothetical protein RL609_1657 [Bacteroidota bacterium]
MVLFLGTTFLYFSISGVPNRQSHRQYSFATDPPQFNLPIDTSVYFNFIFLPWDFQFPMSCFGWYPTCGGCVIYEPGWPLGNQWLYNNNSAMIFSRADELSKDTAVVDTNRVLVSVKDTTAVVDTVKVIKKLSRQEKWQRFKSKLHFFRKK